VLEGKYVRLEPLQAMHAGGLVAAAQDSDWAWMSVDGRSESGASRWIEDTLEAQKRGTEFPFTVFSKETEKVVGSTRYMDVRPVQRGVEIGWTWYSSKVWATGVNPECKFLLMRHAFEDWGAIRVQLKTDNNNVHSQRAILKLGAKYEGRLRNHRIRKDGTSGDTMMYSVTVDEWEDNIKNALRARIDGFSESR
jgi:RimJ/RimL family protein N-acetyltransferase